MDTLRRAEKAAQGTAERALRDLAVALKKISVFEKKKSRYCLLLHDYSLILYRYYVQDCFCYRRR